MEHAWNIASCILYCAGSGKSYTMMGSRVEKGLIPRLCDKLFEFIAQRSHDELFCKVEVSYMEIYNEKVHDLLDPKGLVQLCICLIRVMFY